MSACIVGLRYHAITAEEAVNGLMNVKWCQGTVDKNTLGVVVSTFYDRDELLDALILFSGPHLGWIRIGLVSTVTE